VDTGLMLRVRVYYRVLGAEVFSYLVLRLDSKRLFSVLFDILTRSVGRTVLSALCF